MSKTIRDIASCNDCPYAEIWISSQGWELSASCFKQKQDLPANGMITKAMPDLDIPEWCELEDQK